MLKAILSLVLCLQFGLVIPKNNDSPPIGPLKRVIDDREFSYFIPGQTGPLINKPAFVVLEVIGLKAMRVRPDASGFQFVVRGVNTQGFAENMRVSFTGQYEVTSPELIGGLPLFVLERKGVGKVVQRR